LLVALAEARRGGLGFYQLNLARIHNGLRRHFDGERSIRVAGHRERRKS
jgi:hypothetical protein